MNVKTADILPVQYKGDLMGETKVCNQCKKERSVSDFYTNHVRKDGTFSYKSKCKECIGKNNKKSRKLKPKKSRKENLRCDHCDERGYRNKLSEEVLCSRHAAQYKRHGRILENTRFEQNDYTVSECGNYVIINLRNRQSEKIGETIIDADDLDKIIGYRVHMKVSHKNKENPLYYAIAKVNNKNVRVHHLIMDGKTIDHINNDGLDNRKENLRRATESKNGMNQRTQAGSRSGVTGVNWGESNKTWHANIKKNGEQIRLSMQQSTFDRAVKIRLQAEAKYFKEYSNNYNPETNTIQLTYLSHDDGRETFIEVDMDEKILKFIKI